MMAVLSLGSEGSGGGVGWDERLIGELEVGIAHEAVEERGDFAHDGDQSDLLGFTCGEKTVRRLIAVTISFKPRYCVPSRSPLDYAGLHFRSG